MTAHHPLTHKSPRKSARYLVKDFLVKIKPGTDKRTFIASFLDKASHAREKKFLQFRFQTASNNRGK